MKVISKKSSLHSKLEKTDVGIKSINDLEKFCYKSNNISILGNNDINWIKSNKDQIIELHDKLLTTQFGGDALCNLELIGEECFGNLDFF